MFKVVHFELPADDTLRAKKFYEKAFGWKVTQWPMPGMEYFGVHTGEVDKKGIAKGKGYISGGMVNRGGLATSMPTLALMVPNIKVALTKSLKAGGKLLMPTEVLGGMGLYAKIVDTEGNEIGLWQDLPKKKPAKKGKK